jgi:hypothetical protein
MTRLAFGLALLAMMVPPPAFAKPKGCFTATEESAEQMVRQGLRLREGARGCDSEPWDAGTLPLWQQIDQQYGPQFAHQTEIRKNAFVREFSNDAENKLSEWDGRIVIYFRNYPLSDLYCGQIKSMMAAIQKGGWPAFTKQAGRSGDVVKMNYNPC